MQSYGHSSPLTKFLSYFLACGSSDFLFQGSQTLDKTLTEQGLDHIFFVSEGGHTWANWRLYLNTFAPKLFK